MGEESNIYHEHVRKHYLALCSGYKSCWGTGALTISKQILTFCNALGCAGMVRSPSAAGSPGVGSCSADLADDPAGTDE